MVDKVNKAASNWNKAKISKVSKIILINNSIMALPSYYLSVYPVPDFALDKMT